LPKTRSHRQSTGTDALRMIKIQHAKIGNTWWLQHDEAQANP
jgi:hypothetical protein